MSCKKYKKLASKNVNDNKSYIKKENEESRDIARSFQRKTKITKKL